MKWRHLLFVWVVATASFLPVQGNGDDTLVIQAGREEQAVASLTTEVRRVLQKSPPTSVVEFLAHLATEHDLTPDYLFWYFRESGAGERDFSYVASMFVEESMARYKKDDAIIEKGKLIGRLAARIQSRRSGYIRYAVEGAYILFAFPSGFTARQLEAFQTSKVRGPDAPVGAVLLGTTPSCRQNCAESALRELVETRGDVGEFSKEEVERILDGRTFELSRINQIGDGGEVVVHFIPRTGTAPAYLLGVSAGVPNQPDVVRIPPRFSPTPLVPSAMVQVRIPCLPVEGDGICYQDEGAEGIFTEISGPVPHGFGYRRVGDQIYFNDGMSANIVALYRSTSPRGVFYLAKVHSKFYPGRFAWMPIVENWRLTSWELDPVEDVGRWRRAQGMMGRAWHYSPLAAGMRLVHGEIALFRFKREIREERRWKRCGETFLKKRG